MWCVRSEEGESGSLFPQSLSIFTAIKPHITILEPRRGFLKPGELSRVQRKSVLQPAIRASCS